MEQLPTLMGIFQLLPPKRTTPITFIGYQPMKIGSQSIHIRITHALS